MDGDDEITEMTRVRVINVPPDDPRTPWNDTAVFDPALGYLDYAGWASLAGKLAAMFPQLTAINIARQDSAETRFYIEHA